MNHFIDLYATDPGESKLATERVLGLPQPSFPKSVLIKVLSTVAEFPPLVSPGVHSPGLSTVQR